MNTEPSSPQQQATALPVATRDKERTRAAILAAATSLFNEHGSTTSIAEIAKEAGISKSGLLHHFGSKDALIEAIVTNAIAEFDSVIRENIDPNDVAPGRLLRAYIRALTLNESRVIAVISPTGLMSKFESSPTLDALFEADSTRWREFFMSDQMPLGTVVAIRGAAESLAIDRDSMWLNEEEFHAGREYLLQLTYQ